MKKKGKLLIKKEIIHMIERIKEKNGIEKEKESLELLLENCHFSLVYVHKIVVCTTFLSV